MARPTLLIGSFVSLLAPFHKPTRNVLRSYALGYVATTWRRLRVEYGSFEVLILHWSMHNAFVQFTMILTDAWLREISQQKLTDL